MGPGEMSCMDGCTLHTWLGLYDIHNNPGQVPEWLKAVGPKADQLEWLETMTPKAHRLWYALEGMADGPVGPDLLREFFEDGSILHAMVSDLEQHCRGEREASRQNSAENSGPRAGGDRESTMGRKERDPEGRPQASRQNSVEDSGPGVGGDRESTMGRAQGGITERPRGNNARGASGPTT